MPDTLVLPPDPVVGAGAGRRRPPPERSEPLLRALDQHPRLASRVLEAVDGRVGRLLLPLVAAGGLAELLEAPFDVEDIIHDVEGDRKSTRLNSSHVRTSYAVFCLKKKNGIDKIHVQHRYGRLRRPKTRIRVLRV